jgi:hypothetical protein
MQTLYNRFQTINRNKPIFVLEFGATKDSKGCGKASNDCTKIRRNGAAKWGDEALQAIFTNTNWKMLRGFSWWNEAFKDGGQVNMRVQDNPCLKEVFQRRFNEHGEKIIEGPITTRA